MLKAGIIGLPNVGKSTLFNAVTRSHKASAENYPFCTIEPNIGIVEVMLNAANLALVAFSRFNINNSLDGQVFVFFIITVAAAEVSVGLALIVALYRKRQTAHVEDLTTMKL